MSTQPYQQQHTGALLGTVVWWHLPPGLRITYAQFQARLTAAGLDSARAKPLRDSTALRRAVKSLARKKLADKVKFGRREITWQVSIRVPAGDGVDYFRQTTVTLDRVTQQLHCPDLQVLSHASLLFQAALDERCNEDVSRVLNGLLEEHKHSGAFPAKGGCWFLLPALSPIIAKLERLIPALGGELTKWQVFDGQQGTNTVQVQTVVTDSLTDSLNDLQALVEQLTPPLSARTAKSVLAKLEKMDVELRHNAHHAGQALGRLEDYLAYCRKTLAERTGVDTTGQSAPVPSQIVQTA